MTKIPKLPVMIGTTILFLLSGVFRMASIAANPETGKPRLAQLLLFLAALLVMYVYYKAWAAIQDGHARTTSGKAVGYSFIPLFNLYWIFVVMVGFAGDFNAYLQRHEIDRKPLSGPLFWVIGFAWIFAFFMIVDILLLMWAMARFKRNRMFIY